MIPYGSLYFFYIMFLALIIAVILGFKEKPIKLYGCIVNLLFLFLIFGHSKYETICLLLFYIGELVLIKVYVFLRKRFSQKWVAWIAGVLSILPLIIVKISPTLFNRPIGFLGISYLTFKVVQMVIEIYDGLIEEVNILEFSYFLLFFPTISSGPIDRSRRFMDDIRDIPSKKEYTEMLGYGIKSAMRGIAYKFIIAYLINSYWIDAIPKNHSFLSTLNYMYGYSLFLFFDFAGYSSIAIGAGYILGVRVPENFDKPFISKDIKEFWNRWHMSLSFWFRDYLYTRFVMTALKKKWFKNRLSASYIGFIITMFVMGIWHGIDWHYIIYGLYHGVLIVATDYFQKKSNIYKKYKNNIWWKFASIAITFNIVCFGLLLFSGYLFIK